MSFDQISFSAVKIRFSAVTCLCQEVAESCPEFDHTDTHTPSVCPVNWLFGAQGWRSGRGSRSTKTAVLNCDCYCGCLSCEDSNDVLCCGLFYLITGFWQLLKVEFSHKPPQKQSPDVTVSRGRLASDGGNAGKRYSVFTLQVESYSCTNSHRFSIRYHLASTNKLIPQTHQGNTFCNKLLCYSITGFYGTQWWKRNVADIIKVGRLYYKNCCCKKVAYIIPNEFMMHYYVSRILMLFWFIVKSVLKYCMYCTKKL